MSSPSPVPLDFNNVQGDILVGLPKKTQVYFFFQIDVTRVHDFRIQLAKLVPLITTTAQVANDREKIVQNKKNAAGKNVAVPLLKMSGINIAFSQKGLSKLGVNDNIGDAGFTGGMLADSKALGDNGTTSNGAFSPDWIPAFKQAIDGLILIAGDSHLTVIEKLAEVKLVFSVGAHNAAIHEVTRIIGDTRPGNEKGHEHFGFLDGISQPAVQGVDTSPNPGQETVPQGTILLGRQGDVVTTRPSWALDGSFLAFRYLFQLVPEFDKFTKENPIPGLPAGQGSDLLGARLVGRWKSGAPVDLSPIKDDPTLGRESSRNNNFSYSFPDDSQTQDRCPFAAHTRKTNPRADLPAGATTPHRIIRRGLQFGPEVSAAEIAAQKTIYGRGLLFAAYQSSLAQGFQFIQKSWANNTGFPINKPIAPGFDAIIGQAPDAGPRTLSGTNPNSQSTELALNADWVVPKGGEYFFSPSIPALKGTFAVSS